MNRKIFRESRIVFAVLLCIVFSVIVSCATTKTMQNDYKYEKSLSGVHQCAFEFHLSAIEGSQTKEDLVKNFVYNNMEPDAYVSYKENLFINSINKENFSAEDEDGKQNTYHSEYIENFKVQYSGDSLIIIKYDDYVYYGGDAHGNTQIIYYLIDVKEEKPLGLADIVTKIPDEKIAAFLKKKYSDMEFDFRDSLWPPDTISYEKSGLLLLWNTYSIAPYSAGPIEITVPYDAVDSYLTAKGKLLKGSFLGDK